MIMSKILNFVKEVKAAYIDKYGTIDYFYDNETCLEHWVKELNIEKYTHILSMITVRQYGNFIIIKYIKFEVIFSRDDSVSFSDFWNIYDGIFRECRGTTIDVVNECLVTRPYDKFFNIGECEENNEKNIRDRIKNCKSLEFSNKLDGSLVIARYYLDNLYISSSGMADEDSIIISFAKKCINNNSNILNLIKDYHEYTCLFESISGNDAHIVTYDKTKYGLYLTGMRHVETGELKSYSEIIAIAKEYNVKSTEQYLVTFDDILNMRKNYKASEKEGFVMNVDGYLVKIKCDDYILFHKVAEANCSRNNIIKALYYDRIDDLRSAVPEPFLPKFDEALDDIKKYCRLMEQAVNEYYSQAPQDKVDFFKWIKTVPKFLSIYIVHKYMNQDFSYLSKKDIPDNVQFVKYMKWSKS